MKAQTSTVKGRSRSGESPHTSIVDDEFGEFFNRGDIGEYEGGVAYTQPPMKLPAEADERLSILDVSQQQARRAFFARVVAVIVTACVALLVTAAHFRPQESRIANKPDIRLLSAQKKESSEPKLPVGAQEQAVHQALPVAPGGAAAPPPAPEATEPAAPATIGQADSGQDRGRSDKAFGYRADCRR